MNRLRAYGGSACAFCAVLLAGCSSAVDGTATAPLATVDTDPPSVVRTTSPTPSTTGTPSSSSSQPSRTTTTAPPTAEPSRFEGSDGFYYFTSPSGKFECAVFVTDTSIAGCHGEFPSTAPRVEGSSAPDSRVAPNTIELTAGSPARFLSSGDPRFHRFDGTARALPYGETLSIPGSGSSNGVMCRVEEKTGVSCSDQVGHGFTVSDSAFELK
ncbi:hypothetical protein A2J03_19510 [Rhodococcus sp. EPR-157]|uniref:hypothetical protein n=1 Tax=Rhodococcus sp. EPR-157 TaxID=1813677 RepID=UPI0007BB6F55|nr:hypothetical protein [Rhodococcus sp. EPR-157]KZF11524.1 hypothetical protein A2J03_19510 [Rhodococcus sp. EPR-157]